jgi:lipoate-protein ligase A
MAQPAKAPLEAGEEVDGIRRSVKTVYRRLMTPIIQAMRSCNLPAVLGEDSRFAGGMGHTGDCFAHVAGCDVVHEDLGLKLCGSALRLDQEAVLLQASIPKGMSLVDPSACFIDGNSHSSINWDHENFPQALRLALT